MQRKLPSGVRSPPPTLLLLITATAVLCSAVVTAAREGSDGADSATDSTQPPALRVLALILQSTLSFSSYIYAFFSLVFAFVYPVLEFLFATIYAILVSPVLILVSFVWGWIPLVAFFTTAAVLGLVAGGLAGWSVEEIAREVQHKLPTEASVVAGDLASMAAEVDPDPDASSLVLSSSSAASIAGRRDARNRTETMDTYATTRLTGFPPAHIRRRLRGLSTDTATTSSTSASQFADRFSQMGDDDDDMDIDWEDMLVEEGMSQAEVESFLERISKSSQVTDHVFEGTGSAVDAVPPVEELLLSEAAVAAAASEVRRREGFSASSSVV